MINGIDEKSERKANELQEEYYRKQKQNAQVFYEQGKIDEAIEALQGVPMDDEVRNLHRMLRYADEARGIVSNVSPETDLYFENLAKKLGIKLSGSKE